MKNFSTIIYAINPLTNKMAKFSGPYIEAETEEEAFMYCQNNGLGYCHIDGELIKEIPITDEEYDSIVHGKPKTIRKN